MNTLSRDFRKMVAELLDYDGETGGNRRLATRELDFLDNLTRWRGPFTIGQQRYVQQIWDGVLGER